MCSVHTGGRVRSLRRLAREDLVQHQPKRIDVAPRVDVLAGGTQSTVQDAPGRRGYWHIGVPPSGPFDGYSLRLGNRLLGNPENAAGIEITMQGPSLVFSRDTQVVITGAPIEATAQQRSVPMWQTVTMAAGTTLHLGRIRDAGARAYLCVAGGVQCPQYLGSRSTFRRNPSFSFCEGSMSDRPGVSIIGCHR